MKTYQTTLFDKIRKYKPLTYQGDYNHFCWIMKCKWIIYWYSPVSKYINKNHVEYEMLLTSRDNAKNSNME